MESVPQVSGIPQVLDIDPPSVLIFKEGSGGMVLSLITLKNPAQTKVAFKIKTTHPQISCVRPNTGIVSPNATLSVTIMILDKDFIALEKCKFLIQSALFPENITTTEELFENVEPSQLMETKFRSKFVSPSADIESADVKSLGVMNRKLQEENHQLRRTVHELRKTVKKYTNVLP